MRSFDVSVDPGPHRGHEASFERAYGCREPDTSYGAANSVEPALVFDKVQQKSREGGPRDPKHFEQAYRVIRDLKGPLILLDDVCTGGGHLIAAHRRLHRPESPVVLACTFCRTTQPAARKSDRNSVGRNRYHSALSLYAVSPALQRFLPDHGRIKIPGT